MFLIIYNQNEHFKLTSTHVLRLFNMLRANLLCMLLIIWAGLILGVSFIATPAKFMVPSLSLPLALEIGKKTFHIFNKIEWIVFLLVVICGATTNISLGKWFFIGSLLILLLLESLWLLPYLDLRANQIIAGEPSSPSTYHTIYIIFESLKIIFALAGSIWIFNWTK